MKQLYYLASLLSVVFTFSSVLAAADTGEILKGISHLKQSTLRFAGEKVIYFDPVAIAGEPKDADLIFVTHLHGDHFSIADLKKLMKQDTLLIAPADVVQQATNEGFKNMTIVEPGKVYQEKGYQFETVASYNIDKNFHPKDNKWLGYILYFNGFSYYIAGDTDLIPEMKNIHVDVAFLPMGGKYTMNVAEAVEAANIIKPKIAVPIHFADVVGTWEDAEKFVAMLHKDVKGIILKQK